MYLHETEKKNRFSKIISQVAKKIRDYENTLIEKKTIFENSNGNLRIEINGEQKISLLDVSDDIIINLEKRKNTKIIIDLINFAIQKSHKKNYEELKKIIIPKNYKNPFYEMPSRKTGSKNKTNKTPKFDKLLSTGVRVTSSSGNVNIKMLRDNFIQIMDIKPEFISIKNKVELVKEIMETVNLAIQEVRRGIDKKGI
jgi:DNA-binding protein YbaB